MEGGKGRAGDWGGVISFKPLAVSIELWVVSESGLKNEGAGSPKNVRENVDKMPPDIVPEME